MARNKYPVERSVTANNTPDPETALLVPPTVPRLVPDVEGGQPNTVDFRAVFFPLRVEIPMWAHSNPSEDDNEYLYLYWNDVEVDKKTFSKPIRPEELFMEIPRLKLVEGEHRLHYAVTLFNDQHVDSRPLDIYIDKTPPSLDPIDDTLRIPDYVIRNGVTDVYLEDNDDKLEGTVPPYLGAEPGDVVKWFWSDNPAGQDMVNMMTLTPEHIETQGTQSSSKSIALIFPGNFIRQSGSGTRFVRYEVQDRAGTATQRSLALALKSDATPPPRILLPPRITEASGNEYYSTLEPASAQNGITLVIPEAVLIRPNETVTVYWGEQGTLGGYSTSTPIEPAGREFLIPRVHVPPHINDRAELHYQINSPGVPQSPSHFVTVLKIEGLPYVQCSAISDRVLNLHNLQSATFTLDDWPFRHTSQFVNAWIEGVDRNDVKLEIRLQIATEKAVPTEAGLMVLGTVPKTELLKLALTYQFRVVVEVSFNDKVSWLKFPSVEAQLEDNA